MEVYMYSFTFKNGDVLELKAIKHAEFASHETHCYEATVYFNKKTIGWVNNDGFGGSDTFNAKEPFKDNNTIWKSLESRLAEEHPQEHLEWDNSMHDMTLESWCYNQVNKFLSKKDFNRYIKSKVVYIDPEKPNNIYSFTLKGVKSITQQHIDYVKSKYPSYKILNDMPKEEALKLWISCYA